MKVKMLDDHGHGSVDDADRPKMQTAEFCSKIAAFRISPCELVVRADLD